MTRFGYLGPEGTFTSMALDAWGPVADGERTAFGSVEGAGGGDSLPERVGRSPRSHGYAPDPPVAAAARSR